jgi:alkylated DNA nucleotide flippase Atl1
MPAMQFRTVNSPLGPLTLAGKDGRLMHLVMSTRPMSRVMAVGSVVPCHRVIGANGSLTGYGGGLERKRILLELERGRTRS